MKFKPLIQNHDHNKFINSRSDAKAPEIQYTIGGYRPKEVHKNGK